MALTDNLTVAFEFESAARLTSAVGGHVLTNHATVTFATGKVGDAANFVAASTQYLDIADHADFSSNGGHITVAAWVKRVSDAAMFFVAKWDSSNNREYAFQYILGTGVRFIVYEDGAAVTATGFAALTQDVFHLLIGWTDGTNVNLSVDNGTAVSASFTAVPFAGDAPFVIGRASAGSGSYVDGLVDQVFFWQRAITSGERTQIYNGGAGLTFAAMSSSPIPVFIHLSGQMRTS